MSTYERSWNERLDRMDDLLEEIASTRRTTKEDPR